MAGYLIDLVRESFGAYVIGSHEVGGDATVLIARAGLLDVMRFLRDDDRCRMDMLIDVTALDLLEFPLTRRAALSPVDRDNATGITLETLPRFEVVYHLLSMPHRHRLRIKVPVPEDDLTVPTMEPLWKAAVWGEREAWDMLGVRFEGLSDHRRILLYSEFEGHPLRRDFDQRAYQPLIEMPHLHEYEDLARHH